MRRTSKVNSKKKSEAIIVQSSFPRKRILPVEDNVPELTLLGKILELQATQLYPLVAL